MGKLTGDRLWHSAVLNTFTDGRWLLHLHSSFLHHLYKHTLCCYSQHLSHSSDRPPSAFFPSPTIHPVLDSLVRDRLLGLPGPPVWAYGWFQVRGAACGGGAWRWFLDDYQRQAHKAPEDTVPMQRRHKCDIKFIDRWRRRRWSLWRFAVIILRDDFVSEHRGGGGGHGSLPDFASSGPGEAERWRSCCRNGKWRVFQE